MCSPADDYGCWIFFESKQLKVKEEWVGWCSCCWAMGDAFIWAFDNARRKTFLLLLYIGIKETKEAK